MSGYKEEDLPAFKPLERSLQEIRNAIPPRLFERSTSRSLYFLARDVLMAISLWKITRISVGALHCAVSEDLLSPSVGTILRGLVWSLYWWFQSLIFTGIWAMGHECGHGAFSNHRTLNDILGYFTHTFLLTPYFSWKVIHHRHHMSHGSMERDEVFVPRTRSDLGIPEEESHHHIHYEEYLGDTPIYTLFMLVRQQAIAFPVYLLTNSSGQKRYPRWTNHFNPNALFFTKEQKNAVIFSNIGIASMVFCIWHMAQKFGALTVWMYYGIPYMLVTHWIVMITYLQHTDAELPHYRNGAWNFQRGAAATVDRDFLGWQGRFFLHDVGHCHVVHHFFPKIPWYNGEEATRYLKGVLGEHYTHRNEYSFKALWNNYRSCLFVEDKGDILFYKNAKGQAVRRPIAD